AGELILVVDDEESIRDVTRRTLEAHGYRVETAADGSEAVARFTGRPGAFALVLTDMMMPVMDGAATIRALRALDPGIRIVAVSGLAEGARLPSLARMRHLSKPYTTDELLHTLHETLHAEDRPSAR
ncbi:MAG TPA: response regulator, partial [Gemmatimonadales bacterium]|nr:response regulator [Gemmatimonadales bacterium]